MAIDEVFRARRTRPARAMFESREAMDAWVATGSVEGVQAAVGQIDGALREP